MINIHQSDFLITSSSSASQYKPEITYLRKVDVEYPENEGDTSQTENDRGGNDPSGDWRYHLVTVIS